MFNCNQLGVRKGGLPPPLNTQNVDILITNNYDAALHSIQLYGEIMLIRVSLSLMLATMLLFSSVSSATTSSKPQYDLLIKNGLIIDGSGRQGYVADIAINGDRIGAIGKLKNAAGAREIDAVGMVVAPGFIDMLGQSETIY